MAGESRKLPGYTYLGKGRGERYLTPSGQEISRYRFNEIFREKSGFISRREQERLVRDKDSVYNQWLNDVAENQGVSRAKIARYNSEFNQVYAEASADKFRDKTPDGPLARLLVLAGYRSPEDDHDVGETP
jgi:hypothetical protein